MGAEVAIRLDTEDFLTPESDGALGMLLDALERQGARATFPLVAEKLRWWERAGRSDLCARLAWHAVGYHSATHSLHPTIAEELAPLGWAEGQAAFAAREAAGFAAVRERFGPPVCWTQPGGNWTAAALPVLGGWGVPMEFSEAWNSYLDCGDRPCHYCGLLHWSPPVCVPKPFLSALPGCLPAALTSVREALAGAAADAPPVCVVAHPTELCTRAFWDAVNFARGRRPPRAEWSPAPLRGPAETTAAAEAFAGFLGALREMGVRSVTALDLVARFPDRALGLRLSRAEALELAQVPQAEACWTVRGGVALSGAELLGVLSGALAHPERQVLAVRSCAGPAAPPPAGDAVTGPVPRAALVAAAAWCDRHIGEHGALPAAVPLGRGVARPADVLVAVARALVDPGAAEVLLSPAPVTAERHVKAPERLHWDWPIFPADFAPMGLWRQARLQAWTLKPAMPAAGGGRWRGPVAGDLGPGNRAD